MSNLFVQLNADLLQDAKETIKFEIIDGDGSLQEIEVDATTIIKNNYHFDFGSFIPQTQKFTLDRFFELSKELIDDASEREGIPTVNIVEEYPPLDWAKLGNEVITYRLVSREPAKMDPEATGRPQRTYRESYNYKDKNYGDNIIRVLSRPLDHEIEFTVWGLSNKIVNKRVLWLEELFVNHSWAFRSNGADRFYFNKRLQDGYLTTGKQRIFYRPLRFFLRYSEFLVKSGYEIKNIQIKLKLSSDTEI